MQVHSAVRSASGLTWRLCARLTVIRPVANGSFPVGAPALLAILGACRPCVSTVKAVGCALQPAGSTLGIEKIKSTKKKWHWSLLVLPTAHQGSPASVVDLVRQGPWVDGVNVAAVVCMHACALRAGKGQI